MGEATRDTTEVVFTGMLRHVHLCGVHGHGHLVGHGRQLGQHVTGVIRQPLGCAVRAFWGKADGAADLNNHFRHALTHTGNQFVELGQALAALAIVFTHVQMQHGGTGFVAVHRLLNLLFHGDWDVFREVRRNPARSIGSGGDDQRLLVFRVQVAVKKVHGGCLRFECEGIRFRSLTARPLPICEASIKRSFQSHFAFQDTRFLNHDNTGKARKKAD